MRCSEADLRPGSAPVPPDRYHLEAPSFHWDPETINRLLEIKLDLLDGSGPEPSELTEPEHPPSSQTQWRSCDVLPWNQDVLVQQNLLKEKIQPSEPGLEPGYTGPNPDPIHQQLSDWLKEMS